MIKIILLITLITGEHLGYALETQGAFNSYPFNLSGAVPSCEKLARDFYQFIQTKKNIKNEAVQVVKYDCRWLG